jgi:hypothetical protein
MQGGWILIPFLLLPACPFATCLHNSDCRSASDCNAVCESSQGQCLPNPVNATVVCNAAANTCYEALAQCFPACHQNSDCAKIPTVLHFPNSGVCDVASGRCYNCMKTPDCQPNRSITCGAVCQLDAPTKQYLCFNGAVCADGQTCVEVTTNTFVCKSAAAAANSGMCLVMMLLLMTMILSTS